MSKSIDDCFITINDKKVEPITAEINSAIFISNKDFKVIFQKHIDPILTSHELRHELREAFEDFLKDLSRFIV